jgi:hypothetical protein
LIAWLAFWEFLACRSLYMVVPQKDVWIGVSCIDTFSICRKNRHAKACSKSLVQKGKIIHHMSLFYEHPSMSIGQSIKVLYVDADFAKHLSKSP